MPGISAQYARAEFCQARIGKRWQEAGQPQFSPQPGKIPQAGQSLLGFYDREHFATSTRPRARRCDRLKSNKSILSEEVRLNFRTSQPTSIERVEVSKRDSDPATATAPKSDAELYADALKRHSPGSYGSIGIVLGWGRTRAANAETVLREAGRIRYDQTGRGVFVDDPIPSRWDGEKS